MKYSQAFLVLTLALLLPLKAAGLPRNITAQWEYPEVENIAEFRLYQDGNQVCSTSDPQATLMSCTIDAPDGQALFTITVVFSDGTESAHSEALPFIFASGLKAQFAIDPTEGESPLPVTFDASTSTGTITNYDWMFGDGDSAGGSVVTHTYTAAGNYNVTLKVTDDTGAFNQQTLTVTITDPAVINTSPVAVLSSSASVGPAPLQVQFDGSDSSDSDGTIIAFNWDLGDGGTATSPLVNYVYGVAGTFYASLTVTDDGGLSDLVSTPVLVQPPEDNNTPPTAVIGAFVKKWKIPLVVRFGGSKSYDSDGSIATYSWNFGDGSVGSGKYVWHRYVEAGIYQVTLKVTDNKGAVSAPASFTINANAAGIDSKDDTTKAATQTIINFLLLKSTPEEKSDEKQQ